jgi:hypothetical protein
VRAEKTRVRAGLFNSPEHFRGSTPLGCPGGGAESPGNVPENEASKKAEFHCFFQGPGQIHGGDGIDTQTGRTNP